MIRRERDTELLDRISADPKVRANICYHDHEIDWWPVIRGCAVLSNGEDAVGLFEQTEERVWQAHTIFGPTCRGKRAIETAKAMLDYMVPKWADCVWGATPMSNPAARWFNRQIGFKSAGYDEYEAEGPVELFEYRSDE